MTYLLLSAVFLSIAVAVWLLVAFTGDRSFLRRWWAPTLIAAVVLLVLTAVFDNAMIGAGIMTYASAHTSGITVGAAPIEDFAYPIAAVLLLPALWSLLGRGLRDES